MKLLKLFAGAALAASISASALPANAETLLWTLANVTFGDGGTVFGTFSTDSSTGDMTTYDITTTGGGKLPGAEYDSANSWINSLHLTPYSYLISTLTGPSYIELAFANPLTLEANDPLLVSVGHPKDASYECNNCTPIRYITGGMAVFSGVASLAVPEPAAWMMMLVGFGGVGAAIRSRRRFAAATA